MKVTGDRPHDIDRLRDSNTSVTRIDKTGVNRATDAGRQAGFSRALDSSHARRQRAGSLLKRLERLSLPTASDPSLYGNARSIELLQHVVDSVLPRLDTEDDIIELAIQVLNEEIDQRLQWEDVMRSIEEEKDT